MPRPKLLSLLPTSLAALLLLGAHPAVHAQAIVMAGSYQNFDVLNNTGRPTHGFEMEVWGISKSQLTRIFPSNFDPTVIRYGIGSAVDFPGGVYVRWIAPYDPARGQFTTATPVPPSLTTVPGDSCWTYGMPSTYATAGCEHFGISATANPGKIFYRWLVADPANPGSVVRAGADVAIPAPVWTALPPADPALPPAVVAQIQAPPPPAPAVFGDAQWVRVYKRDRAAKVDLVELMGDNKAVVPEDPAELEVGWKLIQEDPPGGGNKRQRGKLVNQGNLNKGNHAVVRRYEFYKYAGNYDPLTHEALCADLSCTAPGPGELGDAIGAQNAAANLNVNALSVAVVGGGGVSSSDKVFSCGNKCYGVYAPGTTVILNAKANSGNSFSGWGGACAGAATSCTVVLNAESSVTASFVVAGGGGGGGGGGAATAKLVLGVSGSGAVNSTPAGIDCGKTCAASYPLGSAVALSATPAPGLAFIGWSGACTGTAPTCTVTLNTDTKVGAAFSK